jgi:hypothetical protein
LRGSAVSAAKQKSPVLFRGRAFSFEDWRGGNLLSRAQTAHYHRRKLVSRSCSGWEGVVPSCCGRHIEENEEVKFYLDKDCAKRFSS